MNDDVREMHIIYLKNNSKCTGDEDECANFLMHQYLDGRHAHISEVND